MSEGLKPWIYKYFHSYVSNHDDIGKIHRQKGRVQILHFLSVPKTEEEFLWAEISDKDYIIPARFTPRAVKEFNDNAMNAGRPLMTRLSALAIITSKQLLRCRPPLGVEKGLNPSWQIALEVDEVDVIACEGEPQFGEPREFNKSPLVQKWLEGLAKGQGYSIKQHLNEASASERLNDNAIAIIRRNESTTSNTSNGSKGTREPQPVDTFEKRYRRWRRDIQLLGLLACYEHPEVDCENLGSKDALDGTQQASVLISSGPKQPTTPSQWSHSEVAFSCSAHENSDNDSNPSNLLSQTSSRFISDTLGDTGKTEPDADMENHSDKSLDAIDDASPLDQHIHEAKILVPDSDTSHSQPHTLTQTGEDHLTAFSIPETSFDRYQIASQSKEKDHTSAPQNTPCGIDKATPEDLPTNNAEEIMKPTEFTPSLDLQQEEKKRRPSRTDIDDSGQSPLKRLKASPPLKNSHPLHDPSIWKKPSFMAPPSQRNADTFPQGSNQEPESLTSQRDQAPRTNDTGDVVGLKLGGWQPDWALEKIPGVMNYAKFKALLTRVADAHKGRPRSE